MVGPRVAYFGEKTPESSDPTYKAINKMIATKRCAYGILLKTIPDTPDFGKEIQMMIQLGCFIVLVFV